MALQSWRLYSPHRTPAMNCVHLQLETQHGVTVLKTVLPTLNTRHELCALTARDTTWRYSPEDCTPHIQHLPWIVCTYNWRHQHYKCIHGSSVRGTHRSPIGDARIQLLALPSGSTAPSPRCVLLARNCQPMHLASPCTAVIWCW
jgi:hypothetical protein